MESIIKTIAKKDDITGIRDPLGTDIRNYKTSLIFWMFISLITQAAAFWVILELFVKK